MHYFCISNSISELKHIFNQFNSQKRIIIRLELYVLHIRLSVRRSRRWPQRFLPTCRLNLAEKGYRISDLVFCQLLSFDDNLSNRAKSVLEWNMQPINFKNHVLRLKTCVCFKDLLCLKKESHLKCEGLWLQICPSATIVRYMHWKVVWKEVVF